VSILRDGGVIGFPTETVYGLGADAANTAAVERIFRIKGRPPTHPLIVHIADAGALGHWSVEGSPLVELLADRFWPGPLTIILQRSAHVPDVVTGGLTTVGLRVPDHPKALALLQAFGGGLAAPSANRFGCVSPTTADHVRHDLGDAVDVVVDGGPCAVGLESTIVDLSSGQPAILRPGGITREALEEAVRGPVPVRAGGPVRSPGQFSHHYAPRAEVVLSTLDHVAVRAAALLSRGFRVAVSTDQPVTDLPEQVEHIALPTTTEGFARSLYGALREVDRRGCDVVLVTLPPNVGLGLAVRDRLRRATGSGPS
jgi:L-threonylcarbamoyladenylate synthase